MFPKLKKRIKFYMVATTLLIIFCMFTLAFLMYSYFLSKDFDTKSLQLHTQITETVDLKLSQIEDALNFFIIKNSLSELADNPDANFDTSTLYTIPQYCIDIQAAFIILCDGRTFFATPHAKESFENFIPEFNVEDRLQDSDLCWSYAQQKRISADVDATSHWLCTKTIYSVDGKRVTGFITAITSPNMRKFFSDTDKLFCKKDKYYLSIDGYTAPIFIGTGGHKNFEKDMNCLVPKDEIIIAAQTGQNKTFHNTKIHCTESSSGKFRLIACAKPTYIVQSMQWFALVLLSILLGIVLVCLVATSGIASAFISSLENVCVNVDNYINELTHRTESAYQSKEETTYAENNDC